MYIFLCHLKGKELVYDVTPLYNLFIDVMPPLVVSPPGLGYRGSKDLDDLVPSKAAVPRKKRGRHLYPMYLNQYKGREIYMCSRIVYSIYNTLIYNCRCICHMISVVYYLC